MKKTCEVNGCDRKHFALGYCTAHYHQYKKHGKIISESINIVDISRICSVPGCKEKYSAKGYCQRHYTQMRKHGRIISVEPLTSPSCGQKMRSGYIYILNPNHPSADKRGYVKRSWLVWEENTGHIVTPPEVVHHINEIKTDDAFGNLRLLPNKRAHSVVHGGRIGGVRVVTKRMAQEEMCRVYALIGDPLTTRRFDIQSNICASTIRRKFGWNAIKEELCIP